MTARAHAVIACDFLVVETVLLKRLHVLVFIEHGTRRLHLVGVTARPTAAWAVQQARNLAMDLDDRLGTMRFKSEGLRIITTLPRTPWMNATCERVIGTLRRELLDRTLILGDRHLDLVLREYVTQVKLAANAEARRGVVAQVLSYAGYLQGLDPGQLESLVLGGHLGAPGSVLERAQADAQAEEVGPAAFMDGLARSLAEGSFRLVIVLDSVPDELVQVVGYLQSVTDKIDIDLVAVTAYDTGGSTVVVPQRIEPGSRPGHLTTGQASARGERLLPTAAVADARSAACLATFQVAAVSRPGARRAPIAKDNGVCDE